MNQLIELYAYLKASEQVISRLDKLGENKFLESEKSILMGFSIMNEINDRLSKIDKIFALTNEKLNSLIKEFYIMYPFVLNSYRLVNGYLVWDYLKTDFYVLKEQIRVLIEEV